MSTELITSLRGKLGIESTEDLESSSKEVFEKVWQILSDELDQKRADQILYTVHKQCSKILLNYWLYQATKALKVPQPREVIEGVDTESEKETTVDVLGDIEDHENLRVVKIDRSTRDEMSKAYISVLVKDAPDAVPVFSTSLHPFPTTIKSEFSVWEEDSWDLKYEVTFVGDKISKITRTRNLDTELMEDYGSIKKTEIMDFGPWQFPIETVLS